MVPIWRNGFLNTWKWWGGGQGLGGLHTRFHSTNISRTRVAFKKRKAQA